MNTREMLKVIWRRKNWLFRKRGWRKSLNLIGATKDFALKRETTSSMPAVVKIDISPICNLSCTMCVHADPNGSDRIDQQVFAAGHKMTVEQYSRIIDEIKDKTLSVTLYTWGDPMTHPDLDEMCRITTDAGLQTHISTNFSFNLPDRRIRRIVDSGLTHLTVCVDGLSQEKYQRTRVGGRIDWVLRNLERVCKVRDELGQEFPLVEVQFIKFQHNVDELEAARELCLKMGVNQFTDYWGDLHNLADLMPDQYDIIRPKPKDRLPHCYWPHFSTVIKYNGDVIPCCDHRAAAQHIPGSPDARPLGNVFETSLTEVWNSQSYRDARRFTSNPALVEHDERLQNHFCDGCRFLFDTKVEEQAMRMADQFKIEEIYTLTSKGRPLRLPQEQTAIGVKSGNGKGPVTTPAEVVSNR